MISNLFPDTFMGINIIEAPVYQEPVLALSKDCPCSDECRESFNSYLIDMFGYRDVSIIPKGVAYIFGGNIIMRPESIVRIQGLSL